MTILAITVLDNVSDTICSEDTSDCCGPDPKVVHAENPGQFAPMELSLSGPFAPWSTEHSTRSLAPSLSGTYAPRSEMALELSFC